MAAWVAWLVVAGVLGVAEVLTLGLVLGLVAVGALASAAVAAAGAGVALQVLTFAVVSLLTLGVLRPVARRHLRPGIGVRTGVDALVGREALTLAAVDRHGGQVRLAGEVWSARAYDPSQTIPAGATVDVLAIEGATALVYVPDSELP